MDKKEFLRVLREQLEGRLSQDTIEGHIRYYDQYISEEIRMGKTEAQVMDELGSPVFIAKTLSDVAAGTGEEYYSDDATYRGDTVYEEEYVEDQGIAGKVKAFLFRSGIARFLIPVVIVLVMMIAFWLLGAVALIAFRFFSPILLILILVYLFQSFRGR